MKRVDYNITHFYREFNFELALVTKVASCTDSLDGYQEPTDPNAAVRDYSVKFLVFDKLVSCFFFQSLG